MFVVLITKEQAQPILEPHLEKIRRSITDAIDTYNTEYAHLRHRHSARTDANTCRDLIIDNIKREFDDVQGVRWSEKGGLFLLTIDGLVVLKFKKFNTRLLSSNIPTRQTQLLLSQELPGMPPNGLLHVGYLLDPLSSRLEGIYITCRVGSHNEWSMDISSATEVQTRSIRYFKPKEHSERKVKPKVAKTKIHSGEPK